MTETKRSPNNSGFTLLELMITIAIIAIIASIAIPSYLDYTKKSHYSELVRATAPYKIGVAHCFMLNGSFDHCNSSNTPLQGMPPSITKAPNASSSIGKISVAKGVITAVPNTAHGITPDQIYVLTPKSSNATISWEVSGKGVTDGLTK